MKRSVIIFLLFGLAVLFAQSVNITDYYNFNYTTQTYTEITGTVVPSAQGNDVMSGAIDIGFIFPYGSNTYTQIRIASGGYITLGTNTGHTNVCDLASTTYCPYIAAFWEALHTGRVAGGTYPLTSSVQFLRNGVAPNRTITIQYKNAYYWYTSTNSTINFQIVLNENGRIDFLYGSHTGTAPGGSPSYGVGINMLPGGIGNFYSLQQTFMAVSNTTANNTLTDYQPVNRRYSFLPRVPNNVGNVFPASMQTGVSINTVLNWNRDIFGGVPTGYRVYLGTNNPPTNMVNGTVTTDTNFTAPTLNYQTHYYWKIVAFNAAGDAVDAPTWEFTTLNTIPEPVINPNPAHESADVSTNPTLTWSNASSGGDPTGYRVYLGTNNPPSNLINGTTQTSMGISPTNLTPNTRYYWQIVAYNAMGDAAGSSVWYFNTVELLNAVNADFTATPVSGHAPLSVDFTDTSQYGPQVPGVSTIAWNWDFQNDGIDDSFIQNPQNVIYQTPGLYTVKLTIISSNGIASTRLRTNYINVNNQPPVVANPINSLSMPEDTESPAINLAELFTDPDGDALTYNVTGNTHFDTRYSSSSLYLTPKPLHWNGVETIHISALDPFGASVTHNIIVTVTPVNNPPAFNPPHQDAECNWALLSGTSFIINFGDYITDPDTPNTAISIFAMNVSTTQHIMLEYTPNTQGALTGTFTASPGWTGIEHFSLTIRDTLAREMTQTFFDIKVITSLIATPHANIVTGYTGQTIQFSDLTVGNPNSYIWNFGDGATSTTKNPIHIFTEPGNYPVMLTVANTQLTGSTNMSNPIQLTMVGILAPTYNIAAPQHWQIAGAQNQYNVFQNLNIHNSGVLTIDPGVTVNVFDTTGVDIYGSINATSSTFHPIGEDTWGGLRFHNSEQVSHVNNCVIENAKMPISILNGNHEIDNVSINATGQMLEIDNSAIKITGNSSPILHNIGVMNYTTGIYINGSNSRETTTPILTNIRVRNSTNSSREDRVRTAIEISGNTSPVIDNIEIKNVDKGIVVENNSMLFTTTPSLHGIKIVNEPAESRPGEVGLSITGNVNAALDSIYIDYYKTGLSYSDFDDISRDTPILTNIRVRNSTNSSRGTSVGLKLDKISSIRISDCQIDSMSTGIKISNSDSGTTSTPILTNIRVRNSTNSSRFNTTGIDISGYVAPQFNDIWIDGYEQGLNLVGTGTGLRNSTPILTNIRVRNSTNSSRTTSVGFVIKDVVNFTATNDTIDGYSLGIEITSAPSRATSTPILTNIRVRNSTNSSRLDATGIYLGDYVAGSMTECLIEGYITGIMLADGNQTVLSNNLIKNCGYGIIASGVTNPLPISNNSFKLDSDWQSNYLWTYIPISVQFTGPWNIFNNTIWGYPCALSAVNASVTFTNNIVWDDIDIVSPFSLTSSEVQYTYNDIRTSDTFEEGSGNFNTAPLLEDTDNDNFNLTYNSPCIDAGNPVFSHDADSTVTDIGAYPYLHKAVFSPTIVNTTVGTTIDFINNSIGHDDPSTEVVWELGNDGLVESYDWNWSFQFDTPGIFDIKLIVTTGSLADSIVYYATIVVADTLLKAPQHVTLQVIDSDIKLNWEAITETINGLPANVEYYIIYKSDTADGVFNYLDYTNGGILEYTDAGAAVDSEGFYIIFGFEGTLIQLQSYLSGHTTYPSKRLKRTSHKVQDDKYNIRVRK